MGDVDIEARAVELSCGIGNGLNVSDHALEGVAAGIDGEELVCGVIMMGFDGGVGGGGDMLE